MSSNWSPFAAEQLVDHLFRHEAGRLHALYLLFNAGYDSEQPAAERTEAGLTAARTRGRQGGRPKGLSKQALFKAQATKTLYLQQDKTVAEIGQLLGVGRATIYRYLVHLAVPIGGSMEVAPST